MRCSICNMKWVNYQGFIHIKAVIANMGCALPFHSHIVCIVFRVSLYCMHHPCVRACGHHVMSSLWYGLFASCVVFLWGSQFS